MHCWPSPDQGPETQEATILGISSQPTQIRGFCQALFTYPFQRMQIAQHSTKLFPKGASWFDPRPLKTVTATLRTLLV